MIIRTYSSKDTLYKIPDNNVPPYWIRPQQLLSGNEGAHRFMWDMHYQPLNIAPSFPISAVYKNTAPESTSPWVLPGKYTARLLVDGKMYEQSFFVKMDPRVKSSFADLKLQHDLSLTCYNYIFKIKSEINVDPTVQQKILNNFITLQNALQESDAALTQTLIKTVTDAVSAYDAKNKK